LITILDKETVIGQQAKAKKETEFVSRNEIHVWVKGFLLVQRFIHSATKWRTISNQLPRILLVGQELKSAWKCHWPF